MKGTSSFPVRVFLAVQTVLYLLFLSRDLAGMGEEAVPIKYCSIVLCLLASAYWSAGGGDRLVTAAMALTLGADTFLLLLNRHYLLGVLLFCGVQGLYWMRIYRKNGGRALWKARLICCGAAVLLLWKAGQASGLYVLAAVYAVNFVWNAVQSLALSGTGARLFSVGLGLFLCCDLWVAVFNGQDLIPAFWHGVAAVAIWLFYLPAQVLIVLSGRPELNAVEESA